MAFASDKGRQGAAGQGAAGGFSIDNSLRFNDDDSPYLDRTFGTPTDGKKWVWSSWVKKTAFDNSNRVIFQFDSTYLQFTRNGLSKDIVFAPDDKELGTTAKFRDGSAWFHIVGAVDTTQLTAANRSMLYINGERVTDFSSQVTQTLNATSASGASGTKRIGSDTAGNGNLDGYLAEVHFIDGQSFFSDTSGTANSSFNINSFGETDANYKHWKPIEYTGTYGNNGFYLPFSNTGTKHTITVQGDVQHITSPKKIGDSSIHFLYNGGTADILKLSSYPSDLVFSGDFTYEFWAYKDDTSSNGAVFGNNESGYGVPCQLRMMSTGKMSLYMNGSSTWSMASNAFSTIAYTANTWQHWAVVRSGSTITLYKDGVSQGTITSSQAQTLQGSSTFVIGGSQGTDYYNGHLDEIRISNTARYTSGFTPSTTAFTDDANTMLLIHSDTTVFESTTFTDSSGVVGGLGNDANGSNNWTTNNLASTDQMVDTPTNNFCTISPLGRVKWLGTNAFPTLSNGNLQYDVGVSGGMRDCTMGFNSGKWYWESRVGSPQPSYVGVRATRGIEDGMLTYSIRCDNRNIYNVAWNATSQTTIASGVTTSFSAGDIIAVAADLDNNVIKWYKNNSLIYTYSSIVADTYVPCAGGAGTASTWVINFGQDSSFAGNKTAQGNQDGGGIGDFYYTPPSGFLALCTSNLTAPAVKPQENFNTVLYTGNLSSGHAITGVGFAPDFVWAKGRSFIDNHGLFDSVRGASKHLRTNGTNVEADDFVVWETLDSDGFTVGSNSMLNKSSSTFVAWNWKAGGADVLNEVGTIDSQVSANADAGFSIVSYTGTGANATVGHGLSSAPEMIVFKNRGDSGADWIVVHKDLTSWQYNVFLNYENAQQTSTALNSTAPSNTLITLGNSPHTNKSTFDIIAYCFHSVDGYSKVGSYTGNFSTDGTFVYTGFRPAYVLTKRTDASDHWQIFDNKINIDNAAGQFFRPHSSAGEDGVNDIDLLSNGFKLRNTNAAMNASGGTYLYLAFAEHPFKHTNAR